MKERFKNISGVLDTIGLKLEDLEVERGEENKIILTITKDEGSVTAYDCSRASRLVGPILDSEDIFGKENYLLIVSSPGK